MNNEERKQRERALREVALNCFTTEKWEDVSVARIAKLAGVAKGTVYLHFASKDEICACLAQEFYDELWQKYLKITGTGCDQLKQLIRISFSHTRERAQYRHVVQYCQREHFFVNLDPALADALQNAQRNHCRRIAVALNQGMHDKTLLPNAGNNLIGICSTLSGALDSFNRQYPGTVPVQSNSQQNNMNRANTQRTNTDQLSQKEFIDRVTGFILSSVENKAESKAISDTDLQPEELTLEVQ